MRGALNLNGCNKLEKNSFNNILAMKISVAFEFNSTNSSSADTNLDTLRFYQKFYKVATYLAVPGKFKRNREGKYLDGSGENEKRKKKLRKKRKRYKLCREEMDVTEELTVVGLLL